MRYAPAALLACLVGATAPAAALELTLDWKLELKGDYLAGATALTLPDGRRAAVIATREGAVRALGAGGAILWEHKRPGLTTTPLAVGDVDGDGRPEVVGGDQEPSIFCLAADGSLIWETPQAGKTVWGYPVLGDLDADGKLEAVVGDEEGHLSCYDHRGRLRWRVRLPGGLGSAAAVGNVDADPRMEIFIGDGARRFYAFGADGDLLWRRVVNDDIFSSPVLADLDRDGRYEVIFGTGWRDGGLYALDALTGQVVWRVDTAANIDQSIAAVDVDGDGRVEIIFGDGKGRVRLVEPDGAVRWMTQLPETTIGQVTVASAPAVADLDGDGSLEIVAPEHDGMAVYVLNLQGDIIASYPVREGMNGSPLVMNLDDDPQAEIICPAHRVDLLLCLQAEGSLGAAPWPSVRGRADLRGDLPTASGQQVRETMASPLARQPTEHAPPLRAQAPVRAGWNAFAGGALDRPEWVVLTSPSGVRQGGFVEDPGEREWRFWIAEHGRYTLSRMTLDDDLHPVARWREAFDVALFAPEREQMAALAAAVSAVRARLTARPETAALARQVDETAASMVNAFAAQTERFADLSAREQQALIEDWAARRDALRGQVALLEAAAQAGAPRSLLVGVSAQPYAQYPASAPAPPGAEREVRVRMLGGEYEVAAVDLVNVSDRSLTVRAWVEGPPEVKRQVFLARGAGVPTLQGVLSWEVLVPLDAIGAIEIPRLEGRQLWVRADARGLAPGTHAATLRFQPLTMERDEFEIPLTIERLPVELEVEKRVAFLMWANADTMGREHREQVLADYRAHHVSAFTVGMPVTYPYDAQGDLVGAVDWSAFDEQCRLYGPDATFLFPGSGDRTRYVGEGAPPAAAREKAYRDWMQAFCAHMSELGYAPSQYALYPVDEPGIRAGSAHELYEQARRAKEACPSIWVYTDPVGGLTMDEFDLIAPYIDIWQPSLALVYDMGRGQPSAGHERDLYQRILAEGDPVWMYTPMGGKLTDPITRYRAQFWVGIADGHVGQGFWTYFSGAPELDPWQGAILYPGKPGGREYGLVYKGPDGPVGGKRWESSGEGAEETALFLMLREMADAATGPAAERARAFAQSAPQAVIDSGFAYDAVRAARDGAMDLLLQLTPQRN